MKTILITLKIETNLYVFTINIMCGFYGVFSLNQNIKIDNNESIDLTHRGPDNTSKFFDKNFYGKFFRLKILGNNQSNQPMMSYNKRWVIMLNGEIYNYKELAQEIEKINLIKWNVCNCSL